MDSEVKLYIERAQNEFRLSSDSRIKGELGAEKEDTFYSAVISHAYYAIFYAAKAILLTKGIKIEMPDIHKKTYEAFKREFIDSGALDVGLLEAYKKMIIRADGLLQIFKDEKWKRGHFTYHTIPQANVEPAEQSLNNSVTFVNNIIKVMEK